MAPMSAEDSFSHKQLNVLAFIGMGRRGVGNGVVDRQDTLVALVVRVVIPVIPFGTHFRPILCIQN
jgi:hypothetical protein